MWKVTKANRDWTHIRYMIPNGGPEPVTYIQSKESLVDSIFYAEWIYNMVSSGKQTDICYKNFFEDFCKEYDAEYVKEDVVRDYNVSVNFTHSKSFDNELDAWCYIGKFPMGSCHVVTDRQGDTRPEFIPF